MNIWNAHSKTQIADLIREHPGQIYDALIRDRDADFFYHLSSLRHALLSWYPFSGGRALEIGSGFGAMTGLYLDAFDAVDAVETDAEAAGSLALRFGDRHLRILPDLPAAEDTYDAVFLIDAPVLYKEENETDAAFRDRLGRLLEITKKTLGATGTFVLCFPHRHGSRHRRRGSDLAETTNESCPLPAAGRGQPYARRADKPKSGDRCLRFFSGVQGFIFSAYRCRPGVPAGA